jgi:tetratricopeptide (TPR) repeat protein
MALAVFYDQQQYAQKALQAHQAVLELEPHRVDSLYGMAFWLLHEQNLEEAQRYVDQLVSLHPTYLNGWLIAGSLAQQSKHVDKAIQAYQRAVSLNSHLVDPYFNLGVLYRQKEDYQEAAQAFEHVTTLDKNNPEAHVNLGVVYAALSKIDQAEKEYQTALALNPQLAEGHYNLGLLYEFHRNTPQKALKYYQEYVRLGGQDDRIQTLLKRTKS